MNKGEGPGNNTVLFRGQLLEWGDGIFLCAAVVFAVDLELVIEAGL